VLAYVLSILLARGPKLVALGDWSGLVRDRNDDFNSLWAVAPEPAGGSWGGPFRATASDNRAYFVKSLQTCPQDQQASLAVEQIVAQVGRLIGAPVCETTLIRIPAALVGWTPRAGSPPLQEGLAHASLALSSAEEQRPWLVARTDDNNSHRQVGVYALLGYSRKRSGRDRDTTCRGWRSCPPPDVVATPVN